MKLSARKREILQGLDSESPDLDLIEEGNIVYFGLSKSSKKMIDDLLRCCLISPISPYKVGDKYVAYKITGWGRRALNEPDFDPYDELAKINLKNFP